MRAPPPWLDSLFLFVFCVLATDLISGLLHIVLDNPRSLDIALIRVLAAGFQAHHENPSGIYQMPLYKHLYVMHMPLTIVFFIILPFHDARMHLTFLSMVFALHLMQMARRLQRAGILVRGTQHRIHHAPPFDKNFCIMTGICNRPLNAAVSRFGATTHWWMPVFLVAAMSPFALAWLLTSLRG
jgi:ubiquitin-conjugating enzyme E2 variant